MDLEKKVFTVNISVSSAVGICIEKKDAVSNAIVDLMKRQNIFKSYTDCIDYNNISKVKDFYDEYNEVITKVKDFYEEKDKELTDAKKASKDYLDSLINKLKDIEKKTGVEYSYYKKTIDDLEYNKEREILIPGEIEQAIADQKYWKAEFDKTHGPMAYEKWQEAGEREERLLEEQKQLPEKIEQLTKEVSSMENKLKGTISIDDYKELINKKIISEEEYNVFNSYTIKNKQEFENDFQCIEQSNILYEKTKEKFKSTAEIVEIVKSIANDCTFFKQNSLNYKTPIDPFFTIDEYKNNLNEIKKYIGELETSSQEAKTIINKIKTLCNKVFTKLPDDLVIFSEIIEEYDKLNKDDFDKDTFERINKYIIYYAKQLTKEDYEKYSKKKEIKIKSEIDIIETKAKSVPEKDDDFDKKLEEQVKNLEAPPEGIISLYSLEGMEGSPGDILTDILEVVDDNDKLKEKIEDEKFKKKFEVNFGFIGLRKALYEAMKLAENDPTCILFSTLISTVAATYFSIGTKSISIYTGGISGVGIGLVPMCFTELINQVKNLISSLVNSSTSEEQTSDISISLSDMFDAGDSNEIVIGATTTVPPVPTITVGSKAQNGFKVNRNVMKTILDTYYKVMETAAQIANTFKLNDKLNKALGIGTLFKDINDFFAFWLAVAIKIDILSLITMKITAPPGNGIGVLLPIGP